MMENPILFFHMFPDYEPPEALRAALSQAAIAAADLDPENRRVHVAVHSERYIPKRLLDQASKDISGLYGLRSLSLTVTCPETELQKIEPEELMQLFVSRNSMARGSLAGAAWEWNGADLTVKLAANGKETLLEHIPAVEQELRERFAAPVRITVEAGKNLEGKELFDAMASMRDSMMDHLPAAAAQQPKWMLLSYNKKVTASSGVNPELAVNEDIRNWWSADTAEAGEWLCVDLGKAEDVRAIQVNFADEALAPEFPEAEYGSDRGDRRVELEPQLSRYTIETSVDGENWNGLETVDRECSNGYYEYTAGISARYIRVTAQELPYGQVMRIAGLRVFGNGCGEKAQAAQAKAERLNDLEALVSWAPIEKAQGCNVRYGTHPDKLYMSWLVYGADAVKMTTLIKGQEYYVCVDSFNENGITPGEIIKVV